MGSINVFNGSCCQVMKTIFDSTLHFGLEEVPKSGLVDVREQLGTMVSGLLAESVNCY